MARGRGRRAQRVPRAEVREDPVEDRRLGQEGDDLHRPPATGAEQRIVLNCKKRIAGHAGEDSAAVAVMFGAGFVNLFEHAHFEASLLASSAAHGPAVFYGGLRAMQVAPLTPHAVHDTPTAGALFGVRLGNATDAVLPEIAVYYDHSALRLRRGNIIYVPSITLRGELLRRVLRPF
jgi:hypothetical protein